MTAPIRVIAACAPDPGMARTEAVLPEGLTLAQIVEQMLPGLTAAQARARVALVTASGSTIVPAALWRRVRPRAGVQVVIRLIPRGDEGLRSVLSIAVSIASVSLGGFFAGVAGFGFKAGTFAYSAVSTGIGIGVNLVGALLINALVPPARPDERRRDTPSISGWRNRLEPDGAVPLVMGTLRWAPPFAAASWTEIVGDDSFVRAAFNLGEGRVSVSGLRIGETDIAEYDEVETEIREGVAGDAALGLYPRQIVEEAVGVELTRPLPRDDAGNVVAGASIATPVVRTTGADAAEASVILTFPAGLLSVNSKGKLRARRVDILIEQRLVTDLPWTTVTTLNITAKKAEGFFRQHGWAFPSRGRWQVRLTMLTDETTENTIQQRTSWVALQTIRPEYPLAFPRPLALLSMRIRATHQLQGALDTVSLIATRICPDWDYVSGTWITRATSNPASLYRLALQHPSNPKAVADGGIDLALLTAWHDFCRIKGLTCNRVLEAAGTTLREVLSEIAAAGRATPRHDGTRWGVVIDRPSDLVVDHINPRNSWGFRLTRTYAELPHALIVNFLDAANDWRPAQRIIRRPGYTGDIILTEVLDLPGKTDAAEVWREAYRRFLELAARPDLIEVTQESQTRVATRGDTVAISHDVLSRTQWAGRVRRVSGALVELDEIVTMETGGSYAIRFRTGLSGGDTIGTSTVRTVETVAGATAAVTLSGTGAVPEAGDLVHFGPVATESLRAIVTNVETTADDCSIIRAVAAAPEIETQTEAATIPAWSSRVGVEISGSALAPAVPRFTSILSGLSGAGAANLITLTVARGAGAMPPASYEIDHRPGTTGGWTTLTIPAAAGGADLTAYANGATVQLRLRGLSAAAVASGYSPVVTLILGADDLPVPGALTAADIVVATRLGGASITIITPADPWLARLQIYRSATTTLNRATDAYGAPFAAEGARSYVLPVGDQTRVNLVGNGGFADTSVWTPVTDVTIAGGVATKANGGVTRDLTQSLTLTAGETLRVGYRLAALTSGNARVRIAGSVAAEALISTTTGSYRGTIIVPASPGAIGIRFTAAAALSIDDVFAYRPTTACLPQGDQYLWIEPQNLDGTPGPVIGPLLITID